MILEVKDSLSYDDVPVEISYYPVRSLGKKNSSVKVLWRSQSIEGATQEAEVSSPFSFLFHSSLRLQFIFSFQSFICDFNLIIMFPKFLLAFQVYLNVIGTQLSQKLSSQCSIEVFRTLSLYFSQFSLHLRMNVPKREIMKQLYARYTIIQIFQKCRCNLRRRSMDRSQDHGPQTRFFDPCPQKNPKIPN